VLQSIGNRRTLFRARATARSAMRHQKGQRITIRVKAACVFFFVLGLNLPGSNGVQTIEVWDRVGVLL
jgi:hypothetical protein